MIFVQVILSKANDFCRTRTPICRNRSPIWTRLANMLDRLAYRLDRLVYRLDSFNWRLRQNYLGWFSKLLAGDFLAELYSRVVTIWNKSQQPQHCIVYTCQGIFDCLTGPCVTVPGVGKFQGSTKQTQFSGRDIKGFWGIPYGEDTGGLNRFKPPKPRGPINDGSVRN